MCEQSEVEAARAGQCGIRSKVSLFESVFAIAPTAGRNLVVCSSCTANGTGGTSNFSGKLEPTIDVAFARYVGPASLKPYPEFIEIRIGSLDEAPSSTGAPERENWTKRREHWLSPIASAEQACEDARDANIALS